MVIAKLRKSGNSYIVTVPREEMERLGLQEGQMVAVEVHPVDMKRRLPKDLQQAFDVEFERGAEALRYLAG